MKHLIHKMPILLAVLVMLISFQATARDVSCQVEIFKQKHTLITQTDTNNKETENKNNNVQDSENDLSENKTLAEAHLALKKNKQVTAKPAIETKNSKKAKKNKPSKFGGIFDILIPATLRDPIK